MNRPHHSSHRLGAACGRALDRRPRRRPASRQAPGQGDRRAGARLGAGQQEPDHLGSWLFMIGCLVFVWFFARCSARASRRRKAGPHAQTIAYTGAVMAAVFGMLIQPATSSRDRRGLISARRPPVRSTTSATCFVGAELSLIRLLRRVAVLAFRTAVLPRWWAVFTCWSRSSRSIGPIGWAALDLRLARSGCSCTAVARRLARRADARSRPSPRLRSGR